MKATPPGEWPPQQTRLVRTECADCEHRLRHRHLECDGYYDYMETTFLCKASPRKPYTNVRTGRDIYYTASGEVGRWTLARCSEVNKGRCKLFRPRRKSPEEESSAWQDFKDLFLYPFSRKVRARVDREALRRKRKWLKAEQTPENS